MELENDYCKSQDDYPDTITAAYNLLINYKSFKSTHFSHQDELAFFNQKTGRTRRDIKYMICHMCKKKGYYANKCPSLRDDDNKKSDITAVHVRDSEDEEQDSEYSDFSFMTIALNISSVTSTICLNQHTGSIPKTWILLVNCSTTDIFCEKSMLTNIRSVNRICRIISNAGSLKTYLVGGLKGYRTVWYSKDVIKNILSLAKVEKWFKVTYNSTMNTGFIVHTTKKMIIFGKSNHGLFYHDTTNKDFTMATTATIPLLQTYVFPCRIVFKQNRDYVETMYRDLFVKFAGDFSGPQMHAPQRIIGRFC